METHRIGLSLNPDALGMGEDPGSILLTGNNSATTTTADLGLPGVGRAVPTTYVNCKQSLSMLPVECDTCKLQITKSSIVQPPGRKLVGFLERGRRMDGPLRINEVSGFPEVHELTP
jgi:hypothetical protein